MNKTYKSDILNIEHFDEVVKIFTKAFCDHEPMTSYLGINYDEFMPFAKQVIEKAIQDQLSVVILDGRKVAAFAIVEDIADPLKISVEINPKFKFIFGLLESLASHFLAGKKFAENHLSHLFITAVDSSYLSQGLSKKVNAEAMKLATEKDFDFMCCEFTSAFNERGTVKQIPFNKLLLGSCNYGDFVYGDNKPFEKLEGTANAYLWELKPGSKLIYRDNDFKDDQHLC